MKSERERTGIKSKTSDASYDSDEEEPQAKHSNNVESSVDDEDGSGGINKEVYQVTPDDLGAGLKLSKDNKIERIQSVLSGREDEKFKHEGHRGGLTNLEKKRKKNFVMVRKERSVTGKLSLGNSAARYQKINAKKVFGRDKRKREEEPK